MNDGVLAEIAVVGSSKATSSKHHVGVLVSVDFMLTFLNLVVGAPDACTIYIRIRSACSATHRCGGLINAACRPILKQLTVTAYSRAGSKNTDLRCCQCRPVQWGQSKYVPESSWLRHLCASRATPGIEAWLFFGIQLLDRRPVRVILVRCVEGNSEGMRFRSQPTVIFFWRRNDEALGGPALSQQLFLFPVHTA